MPRVAKERIVGAERQLLERALHEIATLRKDLSTVHGFVASHSSELSNQAKRLHKLENKGRDE